MSGKGGVGRSTVAAALGLVAARAGLRTCIVQLNARDHVGRLFDGAGDSYAPLQLDPHLPLYAANLRPQQALREYGQMKLRFRTVHKLVFENDVMRRLLRMIPGMNEMLMLGKAWHMESQEQRPDGSPHWDLLVIDSPATGHGMSLLRLPQVILDAVPFGPMADDARLMRDLLADPRRTALHVVTLPQELPASEAIELCDQAQTVLGMPTGYLFINQVLPKALTESQRRALQAARPTVADKAPGVVGDALDAALAYEHWRAAQAVQIQRLQRHARFPAVELPHLFAPIGRQQLERLAELAEAGMEAADTRDQANRVA